MCCWKANRVDEVTKANEELYDETASTSSATLLSTIFQVLWPTFVSPVIMKQLTKEPLDLGESSKGYTLKIKTGTLSNLRLEFTHVGIVKTGNVVARPFYERSIRTWTPAEVRTWLLSTKSVTEEQLTEVGALLEEKSFNGTSLLACNAQELEEAFKFTKEESLEIIKRRDQIISSSVEMKRLAETITGAAENVSSKSDAEDTDAKEEIEKCDADARTVVSMDVGINLSGSPKMDIMLENDSTFMPNMEADVKTVNVDAKVRIEIDPTHEEIRIGFFERPEIDFDLDIEVTNLSIPMFGESRWLEEIVELILAGFSLKNPIKLPLEIDGKDDSKDNSTIKRSVRRVF